MIVDEIKQFGLPVWLVTIAVVAVSAFFIYRNVRETQLIELQIQKVKKDLA